MDQPCLKQGASLGGIDIPAVGIEHWQMVAGKIRTMSTRSGRSRGSPPSRETTKQPIWLSSVAAALIVGQVQFVAPGGRRVARNRRSCTSYCNDWSLLDKINERSLAQHSQGEAEIAH